MALVAARGQPVSWETPPLLPAAAPTAGARLPAPEGLWKGRVPRPRSRPLGGFLADRQALRGRQSQPGSLGVPVVLVRTRLPTLVLPILSQAPTYQVEEVTVGNYPAQLKLAGTLTAPPGAGPYPAVVLVSDLGQQNRDGQAAGNPADFPLLGTLADHLTRHGLVVLRLDDRGVGKSEGRNSQATPTQRAGDVAAALNYLRTRPEVDLLHLGLIGHGEGASIALLVAAQPLPPAFVVGLGALGLTGYNTLLNQLETSLKAHKLPVAQQTQRLAREGALLDLVRYSTNLPQTLTIVTNVLRQGDASLTAAAAQQLAAHLLTPWHRAFLTFDPLESLPQVRCPVLLISGLADEQAPPSLHLAELERELKANGNRFVTAYRVPAVNHQLEPPQAQWPLLEGELKPVLSPIVITLLQSWLDQQLLGKKKP